MTAPGLVDVAIVGAGPAGLATAIATRRRGLAVVVLEKRHPPLDKPCGEGVMPDGAALLRSLGVDLGAAGARPFRGLRFVEEGVASCEADFPHAPGLGVRRTRLSAAMIACALDAGAKVEFGSEVRSIAPPRVETSAGSIEARVVVVADGLRSPLRAALGLEAAAPAGARRFGMRRHVRCRPWTDRVEVHFVDGAEAYVTPVGDDEVGVALLWSPAPGAGLRFEDLLARFPALAERVAGCAAIDTVQGAGPFWRHARRVVAPGLALVGDAAGYEDAITGEGISIALHQAVALADAIALGDLRRYERAWKRLARTPRLMTRLMLGLSRRPRLRRRALRALSREPALFERLLAIHARERPLRALGLRPAARLAARMAFSF